jgi:hypothetical protein
LKTPGLPCEQLKSSSRENQEPFSAAKKEVRRELSAILFICFSTPKMRNELISQFIQEVQHEI